jgi:TonB family protein
MFGLESLLVGRTLADRYRIEEVAGRGRTGPVFRAVDVRLGFDVAVKAVTSGAQTPEAIETFRARFRRVVAAAAGVHHPNVAAVYDCGTDASINLDFLVMEMLRGEHLGSRLAQRGRPPVPLGLRMLLEAVHGLAAVHAAGVAHGDLRPENLFLTRSEDGKQVRVRLLAFGVAPLAAAAGGAVPPLQATGAAAFVAPEQLRAGAEPRAVSDVFSLGAVGFLILTGTAPFSDAAILAMASGQRVAIRSPRELSPDIPPELAAVILRAISADPAARFPDAANLLEALTPLVAGLPLAPARPAAAVPPPPSADRPTAAPAAPAPPVETPVAASIAVPAIFPASAVPPRPVDAAPPAPVAEAKPPVAQALPVAPQPIPAVAPPAAPAEAKPVAIDAAPAPAVEAAPAAPAAPSRTVDSAPPVPGPGDPGFVRRPEPPTPMWQDPWEKPQPRVAVRAAAPSPAPEFASVSTPAATATATLAAASSPPAPAPAPAPATAAVPVPTPVPAVAAAAPPPPALAPVAAPVQTPVVVPTPALVAAPVPTPAPTPTPAPVVVVATPVPTPTPAPVAVVAEPVPTPEPIRVAMEVPVAPVIAEPVAEAAPPAATTMRAVAAPEPVAKVAEAPVLAAPPSMEAPSIAPRRMKLGGGAERKPGRGRMVAGLTALALLVVSGAWVVGGARAAEALRGKMSAAAPAAAGVAPAGLAAARPASLAAEQPAAAGQPQAGPQVAAPAAAVLTPAQRRDSLARARAAQLVAQAQAQAGRQPQVLPGQPQPAPQQQPAQQVAAAAPAPPPAPAPVVQAPQPTPPPAPAPQPSAPAPAAAAEPDAVQEPPVLSNAAEVQRAVVRNYPVLLRDAGVSGRARVRFVVLENGTVDAASIAVLDASRDAFGDAAKRALRSARYRPARVNGRPVRVTVTTSFAWAPPEGQ